MLEKQPSKKNADGAEAKNPDAKTVAKVIPAKLIQVREASDLWDSWRFPYIFSPQKSPSYRPLYKLYCHRKKNDLKDKSREKFIFRTWKLREVMSSASLYS